MAHGIEVRSRVGRTSCTNSRHLPSGLDDWQSVWIAVRSVCISDLVGSAWLGVGVGVGVGVGSRFGCGLGFGPGFGFRFGLGLGFGFGFGFGVPPPCFCRPFCPG